MAALEKLTKALEALKVVQHAVPEDAQKKSENIGKKEKIFHCSTIADSICSPSLRSTPDFQKMLGFALETFFACCDDDNSDVRLMADECLNKTIKTLLETHLNRLQLELYKEIKKDGAARSLRAALSRFGDLSHRIRPEKFRPYAVNLLPCLAKITLRANEESVQDTLAITVAKVMPVLGQFASDKEIKILLKAFLRNLSSDLAMVRRAAASSLITVSQFSRRPSTFFSWLMSALLDIILPVQDNQSIYVVLGVLLCLRHLVPHISESMAISRLNNLSSKDIDENNIITKLQILKVYELTLFFTNHLDHNVITSTLETLYQLLKNVPDILYESLLSSSGITESLIYTLEMSKLSRVKSESQSSVLPSQSLMCDDSLLEDDQDVYISEKCDDESQVYIENIPRTNFDQGEDLISNADCESDDMSEYSGIKISKLTDDNSYIMNIPGIHTSGTPKKIPPVLRMGTSDERPFETDDEFSVIQSSPSPSAKKEFEIENIGSFTDPDIPLKYCTRLLCSSFLLPGTPGNFMPDRIVRVSVKSLALSCLGSIVSLYPKAFFLDLYLENDGLEKDKSQKIWEIIMYTDHPDPHLKGQCSVVLGNFINYALRESGGRWDEWITTHECSEFPSFQSLLSKLTLVVMDSSSVASKLGLTGVKHCINAVLESVHGFAALTILDALIALKDSSYWLVKVELLEVISEISFKVIYYLEIKFQLQTVPIHQVHYQDMFLNDIIIPMLGDEDFRVRQAAAAGIVKLIPRLFFSSDHPYHDPVIAIAKGHTNQFFGFLQPPSRGVLPLVHALVMPFCNESAIYHNNIDEEALARIIDLLVVTLRTCTNKYLSFGCCQALCVLSENYLVTVYHQAWKTVFVEGKLIAKPCRNLIKHHNLSSISMEHAEGLPMIPADLFNHLIALLTHTTLSLDLVAHQHTLQLIGNLMCGAVYSILHSKKLVESTSPQENILHSVKENSFNQYTEQVFTHLMKLLNIFSHVLDEQPPVVTSVRPALPSLPNAPSLSPMKRKNKPKDESFVNSNTLNRSPTRLIQEKSELDKEKSGIKSPGHVGLFHSSPLYLKLYAILKGAYASYKISMDFQSTEKFHQLLKCCLDVLSQLLEVADSHEMGKHAEEILSYLKSVMSMEPGSCIQSVRQLLKSLFGTNLTALHQEADMTTSCQTTNIASKYPPTSPGLYHTCITEPYTMFTHTLAIKTMKCSTKDMGEELISSLSWMKRSDKLTNLLKSGTKCDKANLAAHIKLFEAVVIKALKLYTITSNVNLQCQVLDLLAQLVQLRVNYCLLDSDQIFIGFILKQIEYIEEGQIIKAGVLIPRIFYFLVLLSYERYHSKSIISVPKILQMCDGLIASGQPPEDYVIKALQPVVEDLFLVRGINKVDLGKELDAQREVVISTLFKLLQYEQVSALFLLIVNQTWKEGEDKWRKLSRQIVDALLPLLAKQQLQVDSQMQLNVLHKLLESVAESVFRPVDILLKALFTQPKDLNSYPNLHRWMSMVLVLLRIIISQMREEVVLSRMHDMGVTVNIYRLDAYSSNFSLNTPSEISEKSSQNDVYRASTTLARFLFQVVGVCVSCIYNNLCSLRCQYASLQFLCQQMTHLLLYLMHMFQFGTFRKVAASAMEIVKNDTVAVKSTIEDDPVFYSISDINKMFLSLSAKYPTLVAQWCNVLTLLNYDCQVFWSQILQPMGGCYTSVTSITSKNIESLNLKVSVSCNSELVRRCGVILLCDYVCENPNDVELMTLLIVNHVNDLIHLSMEMIIKEFFSAIHRNPVASGLLIQAVNSRCTDFSKSMFVKRALHCLEGVHNSQSGNLLLLLVEKFLPSHRTIVARNCDRIICKRLEMLLNDPTIEPLHFDDVFKLINFVNAPTVFKRHSRILSLLKKLQNAVVGQTCSLPTHPLIQTHPFKDVEATKDWFISFIKGLCLDTHPLIKECSLLLSHLKYEDIVGIMSSKGFQLQILARCLKFGAEMSISSNKCIPGKSNDPFLGIKSTTESPLYRASRSCLMIHVSNVISALPRSSKCVRLQELFTNESFWEQFHHITSAVSCYLKILKLFHKHHNIHDDSLEDIAKFSILCCEAMLWILSTKKKLYFFPGLLHISLEVLSDTLKNPTLFAFLALTENSSWTFSTINAIYQLVIYLNPKMVIKPVKFPDQSRQTVNQEECLAAQKACVEMAMTVEWMENIKRNGTTKPSYIFSTLGSVIRGLSRLPLVNSFCRTPPILWQLGWNPDLSGDFKILVPPPPGEYLQDRDVLKQYIYRVNLLGWTSRQQFEETWMALLGVLSATPIDEIEGKEEDQERMRTSCLAVKSITSLLLQTLLLPEPGNPQNSSYLMQPRDRSLAFLHTKCGKKMLYVRSLIHRTLQELTGRERDDDQLFNINIERIANTPQYAFSQVSLEYLCAAAGFLEENDEGDESISSNSSPLSGILGGAAYYHQRELYLAAAGLDIHSCLHFLLDLYSQWLSPVACPCTPPTLLTEVVRSVVTLSDIFMEKAQFEWLLDTLLEVQRVHPAEDEIIAQYLIYGICKAAAVLGMEADILERLKKLLELNLKSTFLPTRIATLHGFLFLLEHNGGTDNYSLISTVSEYILKHLDPHAVGKPSGQNEDHSLMMWSVSFYIMENYQEEATDFNQKIFELSLNICASNDDDIPTSVYLTVFHGLERLLISGILTPKDVDHLLKITADKITSNCPQRSLVAIGALLSCMYVGKSANFWPSETATASNSKSFEKTEPCMETDNLIAALERVTTLFERIRRGYPLEAVVICQILPPFLMEFFPVQDVLNKVIGEFLSSQQPYPHLIAHVIYEVFQYLHIQSCEDMIQDWVMLSLSNFTQRSPIAIAIWSLCCFFISSTSNPWLRAIFPFVQNRMLKIESTDRTLFCISGVDFRNQLKDEEQKQSFFTTMQSVANPDTPYSDLLICL